jgi:hypothetical protein
MRPHLLMSYPQGGGYQSRFLLLVEANLRNLLSNGAGPSLLSSIAYTALQTTTFPCR